MLGCCLLWCAGKPMPLLAVGEVGAHVGLVGGEDAGDQSAIAARSWDSGGGSIESTWRGRWVGDRVLILSSIKRLRESRERYAQDAVKKE
jgi:hypothetical protein